jgi:ArsR family transcriptional regulator, arsenate/arsenite/antimonite-responsive transcriptional repressor
MGYRTTLVMQRECDPAPVDARDRSTAASLYKALADPHRLTILATLASSAGEVCVCDFTSALPLNQPTVSHHLKVLREAGLVASERRGTWVYYRLAPDALAHVEATTRSLFALRAAV